MKVNILWKPSPKEMVLYSFLRSLSKHYCYFGLVFALVFAGMSYYCLQHGVTEYSEAVAFLMKPLGVILCIFAVVSAGMVMSDIISIALPFLKLYRKIHLEKVTGQIPLFSHGALDEIQFTKEFTENMNLSHLSESDSTHQSLELRTCTQT